MVTIDNQNVMNGKTKALEKDVNDGEKGVFIDNLTTRWSDV